MFMMFLGTFLLSYIHPVPALIWFFYAMYKWDDSVTSNGAKVVKRSGADKWRRIWLDGRKPKKTIWAI